MKLKTLVLFATLVSSSATVCAQNSALADLVKPRDGRVVHFSSYDRKGGNGDFWSIAPGETATLLDHKGAGTIRRWWTTVSPFNSRELQRQLVIRCYWDGETTPSVEVPLGDFFGVGFGEWHQFASTPLNLSSGGNNAYWAMPFGKSARVTVENRSKVRVDSFYFNIDLETSPRGFKPSELLYFHAQYRQSQNERGKPFTVLEARGRGHYVGTLLSMQNLLGSSIGFLEGDERIFIDGETTPSIIGTGTEDYFSSGWYFNTGTYAAPEHGVTIKDEQNGRVSAYRWHISDPIPFRRSLKFDIEHGGVNDFGPTEYSSVAFWYQNHPRAPFPALPQNLMPAPKMTVPRVAGLIEGESLLANARTFAPDGSSTGRLRLEKQDMTFVSMNWSGLEHLWWRAEKVGERLLLDVPVEKAGEYNLSAFWTRAPDYADVQISVNGQALPTFFKGYDAKVSWSGEVPLGKANLRAGNNEIELKIVGKDARSSGYYVGLDGFLLKP